MLHKPIGAAVVLALALNACAPDSPVAPSGEPIESISAPAFSAAATQGTSLHWDFQQYTNRSGRITTSAGLNSLTFWHFHNHNSSCCPTSPSYDVQLQIDTGIGFVDIGSAFTASNATNGQTPRAPSRRRAAATPPR
jgi:hypothetical protein